MISVRQYVVALEGGRGVTRGGRGVDILSEAYLYGRRGGVGWMLGGRSDARMAIARRVAGQRERRVVTRGSRETDVVGEAGHVYVMAWGCVGESGCVTIQ